MDKSVNQVFSKYLSSDENLIDIIPYNEKNKLFLGLTSSRLIILNRRGKSEKINSIPLSIIKKVKSEYNNRIKLALIAAIYTAIFLFFGMVLFQYVLISVSLFLISIFIAVLPIIASEGKLILTLDSGDKITFTFSRVSKLELHKFSSELKQRISLQLQNQKEILNNEQMTPTTSALNIPGYKILEKLGEGGFATVYRAIDEKGREVAIKVYKQVSKNFVNEVAIWSHLDHPNIVKLLKYDVTPFPYIVMEYMRGGTLEGKKFDRITATRIILDVLSALKYAHSKGVIHSDIKPSNILLDENSRAKLSDWGIAKVSGKTTTSDLSLTIQYASPEQLTSHLVDFKSDIYQVCEVYYEILTGKQPFGGEITSIFSAKLSGNFISVSSIDPSLKDLDPLFHRCLSPRKEDRPSIDELIKILSDNQINMLNYGIRTSTVNKYYALAELVYAYVKLGDYNSAKIYLEQIVKAKNYEGCANALKKINEKIRDNLHTDEEILNTVELCKKEIGLKG